MKAICTCVNYADMLALSLANNARFFAELLVVTSPQDEETQAVVAAVPRARCLVTNAFHHAGAKFNKGLAMEEGFDSLGRDGWICVLDADTLLPPAVTAVEYVCGNLYSPYRRMCRSRREFEQTTDWSKFPIGMEAKNGEFAGYCQIFHAMDPILAVRPWYNGVKWTSARGCDSEFWWRWPKRNLVRPAFEVLHLGDECTNWDGRVTERW